MCLLHSKECSNKLYLWQWPEWKGSSQSKDDKKSLCISMNTIKSVKESKRKLKENVTIPLGYSVQIHLSYPTCLSLHHQHIFSVGNIVTERASTTSVHMKTRSHSSNVKAKPLQLSTNRKTCHKRDRGGRGKKKKRKWQVEGIEWPRGGEGFVVVFLSACMRVCA